MVERHPISTADLSRLHKYGGKVLLGLFLGYALIAGGIWKSDALVADLEELETMDAWEIHVRKLNAGEVTTTDRVKISYSQWQMEQQNCLEETLGSENPL